jgi:hypothetical protein
MNDPDDSERDFTTFDALFQPLETPLRQHEQDHPVHHREVLHFAHLISRVKMCHVRAPRMHQA